MTVNVSKPVVNVREKLAELDKPTGIAGEAMLRAETPQEQFNLIGAGRRNLIINGDMQVWQRGTSFTGISNGQYTADRWAVQRTGTVNVTRTSTGLNGFPYALRITTTSTSSIKPIYWIEMNNALYVGQTVTLSFWARASANGFNYDITGYNGTSAEAWAYTDDLGGITTEWKKFTVTKTLTVDGVSNHYRLHWVDDVASGDWLEITGVQLELGKVATPFEHRSYGEELALCQRYYQRLNKGRIGGVINGSGVGIVTNQLIRPYMRANPTASVTGTIGLYYMNGGTQVGTSISSLSVSSGYGYNINKADGSTGDSLSFWCDLTSTKFISFDAEL